MSKTALPAWAARPMFATKTAPLVVDCHAAVVDTVVDGVPRGRNADRHKTTRTDYMREKQRARRAKLKAAK